MDQPGLPPWLADMAEQAQQMSRDMQPVLDTVRTVAPHLRQVHQAAAAVAPALAAAELAQRQITGMVALLEAVHNLANSDGGSICFKEAEPRVDRSAG